MCASEQGGHKTGQVCVYLCAYERVMQRLLMRLETNRTESKVLASDQFSLSYFKHYSVDESNDFNNLIFIYLFIHFLLSNTVVMYSMLQLTFHWSIRDYYHWSSSLITQWHKNI